MLPNSVDIVYRHSRYTLVDTGAAGIGIGTTGSAASAMHVDDCWTHFMRDVMSLSQLSRYRKPRAVKPCQFSPAPTR